MDFLHSVLVALHLVGVAALVGIWFATFKKSTVSRGQLLAAIAQLVTGLCLVGLAEAGPDPVNHAKIGVKTVISLIVLITAIIGYRKASKQQPVPTGLAHAVGGFALINLLVATLWN